MFESIDISQNALVLWVFRRRKQKHVLVFSVFNLRTPCADHIRGYSAKELVSAHVSDYWTPPNITFTPPKMTGDRLGKNELITNQPDNEPN